MKQPRENDNAYLDFIRQLPCCICGDSTTTEAAHIRFADRRAAKRPTGMGEKPSDVWALPLCGRHHREQHTMNERKFWIGKGLDPIFIALALNRVRGNIDDASQIVGCSIPAPLMAGERNR